jgi:uncharacterized protein YjeT (DUF2065 family)
MSKPSHPSAKPPTADEVIQEEAMRMARRVQKPGQTKEQTKLIAQGIAKGIELYKQQQSAKARERDKARKRALKQGQPAAAGQDEPAHGAEDWRDEGLGPRYAPALWTAASVFAAMALAQLLRAVGGFDLVVGAFPVPTWVSLAAAALLAGLSSWFFYLAAASR